MNENDYEKNSIIRIIVLLGTLGLLLAACGDGPWSDGSLGKKYAAVKSDMTALAQALEKYYLDYNTYPKWSIGNTSVNGSDILPSFDLSIASHFAGLKPYGGRTNGKLKSGLICDAYAKKNQTLCYYSEGEFWIIWSPGPDGDYDISMEIVKNIKSNDYYSTLDELKPYTYTPISGDFSDGDVLRIRQ